MTSIASSAAADDTPTKQEKRMSYRVPPPPAPLNIPEPVDRRNAHRPSSPLRNGYTAGSASDDQSEDGSIHQDDEGSVDRPWSQRSHSPSPSITKFASNIGQRLGALVGSTGSRSMSGLPTEAELEAEAERERERSRREAEMIMRREAEEKRMVEEGVFAMIEAASQTHSLPPPPPRSQTMSSNTPSPSSSPKEKESWFSAVKSKLTPSKDPLTPAQQIIQETKAKEKDKKKGKDKEKDWPLVSNGKLANPAFMDLVSSASSDPITPPRPIGQNNSSMTPSPKMSLDSREGPPLYAQFNPQGTLDVSNTLMVIARRFEKLERWTVSHVRALEDRMGDVERWLVDKEKEKETASADASSGIEKSSFHSDDDDSDSKGSEMNEIRDELAELQGRVGELGREMAKLMVAPPNLNAGPARSAVVSQPSPVVPPTPISTGPRALPTVPVSTPRTTAPISVPSRPREASPPPSIASSTSVLSTNASRTRLPYPTGDYTSPPGSIPTKQDALSPPHSPPSSINEASRRRPMSIAGLPSSSASLFTSASGTASTGLPRHQDSPPVRTLSPSSPSSRMSASSRHSPVSMSPTPRKRYTVALGAPITSVSVGLDMDDYDSRSQRRLFSSSPVSTPDVTGDEGDSSDTYGEEEGDAEARAIGHTRDDTIGKSDSRRSGSGSGGLANPPSMPNDTIKRVNSNSSPRSSPGRVRAQSSYGPPSGSSTYNLGTPSPIAPLRLKVRSKSIDRIGLGITMNPSPGKFVDPLVVRKQEKDALLPRTPKTPTFVRGQKVPIGELVAFFDSDKR